MEFFNEKYSGGWREGDILIYKAGSNNALGETSLTGHTAVLSNRSNYVIEASKTEHNGAKVFHWNVSNYGMEQVE